MTSAVGTVCVVALSACGAGQQAGTSNQITSAPGSLGTVGSMQVRDAQFVWSDPVPGGAVYEPGDVAPLQVTIANNRDTGPGADRLVSVSSPVATSGRIVGDPRIADGQTITAGYDDPVASVVTDGARAVEIALVGLTAPIRAGMSYPVVFTFEQAGELRVDVGVENPQVLPPRSREGEEQPEILSTGPDIEEVVGDR